MTSNSVMNGSTRLHVLHVTPCYAPAWAYGRVPQAVAALARAQTARGHSVTVLTSDAVAPHEREAAGERVEDGIRVIRFRNASGLLRWWLNLSTPVGLAAIVRALLAREAVDVLHLHELHTVENRIVLRVVNDSAAVVASAYETSASVRGARNPRAWGAALRARHLARIDRYVDGFVSEAEAIDRIYREARERRARSPRTISPPRTT